MPNLFARLRARRHSDADQAAKQAARDAAADAERTERAEQRRASERMQLQWAQVRAARQHPQAAPITAGESNYSRARVPWAVDLAAAWSWRILIIAAALIGLLYLLGMFLVVVLPLIVALLITALVHPVLVWLTRYGLGRRFAALVIVVVGLALVILLLTFVSAQVSGGMSQLSKQVVDGVGQIRDWLRTGPLHVSDKDIQNGLSKLQSRLSLANGHWLSRAGEVGTTVGHVVAGFFIVLFATYFFLADGPLIWSWLVRLFPRTARLHADSSGKVAWRSLTQFVRATVLVAGTDAIGIMVGAIVLGVPFASAIGVLVFLGAFVPMIGATVSGAVAVLVALVAKGPIVALVMLGVVILVQQVEAHILQPFLMGRFVSVHPLGVIIAIACGVIVAGIPGALIAVPFAAALNAVVNHLANFEPHPDDGPAAEEDTDPGPTAGDGGAGSEDPSTDTEEVTS